MKHIIIRCALAVPVLAGLIFAQPWLGGSFDSLSDVAFVVGTCWPQYYNPDSIERMADEGNDHAALEAMHQEWRQVWKAEK